MKIGRPLPADLPTSDLERHYIADGLLWEGFHYDDPPLTVGIGSRPLATSSGGDPKIDRLGPNPAETAQRRGPVVAIRVHGPGPVTETGIGVGSTLAMLRRAYPDLSVHPIPPTLVDDTGVATTRVLEGVSFVFPSCAAAERGATIKRIDLWQ